ncbi:XrtA-associated tyrosine autokinase [Geobacter pickeringii]|uniref:XrtA-associated tyrosine autokinase n=1 Tax=Geobacter pickeringii TaxID=345632 RepID=UPI0009FC572E|nr:XrtA-associated tyrosine autokinase [Geobacter pickeringii]
MSRIEQALEKAARSRDTAPPNDPAPLKNRHEAPLGEPPPLPPPLAVSSEPLTDCSNPLLATLNDPHSPVTEQYRKLKSEIVAATKQAGFNNMIMVTSAMDGEGKSVTSLNLAITLAQEFDHTVLLIDADLRKPSIPGYLGMTVEKGLSEYLAKGGNLPDILHKTGIGRLTVLPAGAAVKNPVELLSSQRMKDLLDEIKARYPDRYVIIDTPPVLPFAETRSLSRMVDGVIFVVKEGENSLKSIDEAVTTIDRRKVIGIVYNEARTENLGDKYDYYRGYRPRSEAKAAPPAGRGNGAAPSVPPKEPKGLWGRLRQGKTA